MAKLEALKIGDEQIRLLQRLSDASSVSGDEGEVRSIVLEQVKLAADEVEVDALGNVLVKRFGKTENNVRVMLAAHMDEVGLMITHKDGDGVFRFELVGGLPVHSLPATALQVGHDHIPAIVGAVPIHLTSVDERKKPVQLDNMRIDVGMDNDKKVEIGDRAVFATRFSRLDNCLWGKALDDRLGTAILIDLIKNSPPNIDLLAAFTVQEEVGLRGASVAAYQLDPEIAVVLDCTPANDLPAWDEGENQWSENSQYNTHLGKGPAIYVADQRTISDPRLVSYFVKTADEKSIPYQIRQPGKGATDAGSIHKQRGGIPSISISVPARYIHTAVSLAKVSDWENTLNLLYHCLYGLTGETIY